ncbi:tipE homolog 4 phospholipid transfer protein [Anoplolepis gracilipes]|uniref:tipE homolog 4 phospholipid transfer protein n=1 Tax=Anoplolepis gracilipes TaxID=354296 RepID=UPI003BA30CA7
MGRKQKRRLIPEQDRRICGSICFFQFTFVISCVALVYLSVAIYAPSYKAFHIGIEPEPVMCQTVNATMVNNCAWASCGEWCLTKTSGYCAQLHATVRRNGTDVVFENCTKFNTIACPEANMRSMKKYNCNNGSECSMLTGVFNCSLGHCSNMSELILCHVKADGIVIDSEKDNMKLNGFFSCQNSRCTKIKSAFTCDRYCPNITTSDINVYLMQDNSIISAKCSRGMALNRANGSLPGTRLDQPVKVWDEQNGSIIVSCFAVTKDDHVISTEDCVNGTLLTEIKVPQPSINFTSFLKIYERSLQYPLDPTNAYIPAQKSLTIYNSSRLYINLERCVNTLKGECRQFLLTHGRDGDNQTAQSRYPCYYNKNDSFFVVARFDLKKTRMELLIAIIVPAGLFIISVITLIIISRSVKVGDDAKMRCRYCVDKQEVEGEDEGLMEATSSATQSQTNENEIRSMAL